MNPPPWICHEVTTFPANCKPFFIISSTSSSFRTLSLTSIYSMHRHRETNPHFLPHQQPPQPRGRPSQQQHHPRPEGDPARSRQQRRARSFPSQPHPDPHADPADSQQHPETPQGGADHPPHSGDHHPVPSPPPQNQSQQHPDDRRVRFATQPEHPSPQNHLEPRSDTFPLRHPRVNANPSQQQPGLRVPEPQKTKPLTWFAAVFCVIFWVIIIVGGLIVLIVYMLFRPRSPRFDVSGLSLNAAYLDMGYLLNADVTVLANFTNPNKKVHVDFSYLVLNLYYEDTLIASRSITPFSAASMQTMFADVHMVTSQVRLPIKDSLKFAAQVQKNEIEFQLKGYFRTRSNLGSFLRYSYWLYGKCSVVVTAPPSGVLVSRSCRTKR